jgi:hypothetical protein
MTKPDESSLWTKMDAMDSIVLSTYDACCTIQLLCHIPSHLPFAPQWPRYAPFTFLDQGYRSDQAAEGLWRVGLQ